MSNRKRRYKEYLFDDDAPIPKRSQLLYDSEQRNAVRNQNLYEDNQVHEEHEDEQQLFQNQNDMGEGMQCAPQDNEAAQIEEAIDNQNVQEGVGQQRLQNQDREDEESDMEQIEDVQQQIESHSRENRSEEQLHEPQDTNEEDTLLDQEHADLNENVQQRQHQETRTNHAEEASSSGVCRNQHRSVFMVNKPKVQHDELENSDNSFDEFQAANDDVVENDPEDLLTVDIYEITDERELNEGNTEEDNERGQEETLEDEIDNEEHREDQDELEEQQLPYPNPVTHSKLRQELDKEMFTAPISTPVNASPAEALLMALCMAEKNNLSFKAFVDSVKLINSLFPSPVIPNSAYLLDKLFNSSEGVLKYFFCQNCSFEFGIQDTTVRTIECTECGETNDISDLTKASFFVMYPLGPQIELLFMDEKVRNQLRQPKQILEECSPNVMKDLYDGKCYRDFVNSLPESDDLVVSLTGYTDGSPLFKSSNFSIWPFFVSINELPPLVRMKNILLGGLWFGKKKPHMDLFLGPIVEQLRKLESGFSLHFNGEESIMHAYIIAFCVDSGARGAVQGLNTHSGFFSCNWCEIPGEYFDHKVVFPFPVNPPKQRSEASVVAQARECLNDDKLAYVYGVQYLSPLANLSKFNIVEGMVLDYAHNVPFGITRTFLTEWLTNTNKGYYIGAPDDVKDLDRKILKLTPPIEIRRPVRKISECANWNAREYENWTLHFSFIVISGVLPMKYVTHWTYLIQGMFLLSRQNVTSEDVNNAHKLFLHFERDVEVLYGKTSMSYNIHIFGHHMAENTVRWGPSWAVSTFCAESGIKDMKGIVHAQRGVPHQVHRSINYRQATYILKNSCKSDKTEAFEISIDPKPNKMTKYFPVPECVLVGQFSSFRPTAEELYLLENSDFNVSVSESSVFNKLISGRCVYTSEKTARSKKYNNSCASTIDSKLIIIKKIVLDRPSEKVFLFCVEVLAETFLRFPQGINLPRTKHFLRQVTSIGKRLLILSVSSLSSVYMLSKTDEKTYVGEFPNVYNVF